MGSRIHDGGGLKTRQGRSSVPDLEHESNDGCSEQKKPLLTENQNDPHSEIIDQDDGGKGKEDIPLSSANQRKIDDKNVALPQAGRPIQQGAPASMTNGQTAEQSAGAWGILYTAYVYVRNFRWR